MTARPVRKRLGGRSARITETVLETTLALMEQAGSAGLSFAAVSERSGIHPTTLYRRFGTPERLGLEAALHAAGRNVPVPDGGSLDDDLGMLFRMLGRQVASPLGRALLLTAIGAEGDSGDIRDRFWSVRLGLMADIFIRAADRGEISLPQDPQAMLETLLAPIYMQFFVLRRNYSDKDADRLSAAALATLRRAFPVKPPL